MSKKINSKIEVLGGLKRGMDKVWSRLSESKKAEIEKRWDIEHAYYSSTLEGNGLDRKKFNELAKKIR